MKIQKIIPNIILLISLFIQSSCATKALWKNNSYEEQITQFFLSADQKYIVLIGENYHYVLTENSGVLKEILGLKQQKILTMNSDKTYLKLDSNNDIAGDAVIEGPSSIMPAEDMEILKKFGMSPDKNDMLSIKIHIEGKRHIASYLGRSFPAPNAIQKIRIYYSDSAVKKIGKIAITPFAIIIDGAYIAGKIVTFGLL